MISTARERRRSALPVDYSMKHIFRNDQKTAAIKEADLAYV